MLSVSIEGAITSTDFKLFKRFNHIHFGTGYTSIMYKASILIIKLSKEGTIVSSNLNDNVPGLHFSL